MTSDRDALEQWDRVSAELEAYRNLQQEAWGDVDNVVLGRYLAGDATTEERSEIEAALRDHPQLRELTDLVRDVLQDFEPVTAPVKVTVPVAPAAPEPRILSFPPQRKPKSRFSPFRQRAAL